MSLKNKSMYAILGILNLSPCSGYDIKKYSDTVLAGFWNENFGHIYPTLKMLKEDGMVEIISGEENEKKVRYGITAKGIDELNSWLGEETLPQSVRSEFLLKLLFSDGQPKKSVIQMLEKYKEYHEKNIAKYVGLQQNLSNEIGKISEERICYLRAVLRRGIISDEAVVKWCDETIDDINKSMN